MAIRNRVGRNESCPCGSGDKFKRCHGRGPSSRIVPKVKHYTDPGEDAIRWVITNEKNTAFFVDKQGRILVFTKNYIAANIAHLDLFIEQGPNEIRIAGVGPTKFKHLQETLPFIEVDNFELAAALLLERINDQRKKLGYELLELEDTTFEGANNDNETLG